jgi:RNA polymerase sigma-70 factor (ECF subfamily)
VTDAEEPDSTRAAAQVARTLDEVFRREHARVLAVLVRDLRDLDIAEEGLSDAMAEAVAAWERDGLPDRPAAWLLTAARRRGIDRIRRADAGRRAAMRLAAGTDLAVRDDPYDPDASTIPDERLKLLFTCCHPALAPAARVALTLRTIAGLDESAIARAFLVSEAAMARRLGRARRKIRDANIPYRVPADHELTDRLRHVLHVVELVFSEGYLASSGDDLVRPDLMEEAIRLARLLTELLPDEAEVQGLLALLLLQHARTAARTDAAGDLVLLEDQDRTRWNVVLLREGTSLVQNALSRGTPGPFQVQAAIAALHGEAMTFDDTDWTQIAALYGTLQRFRTTPIVALNKAVAVAMAEGPTAGLRLLDDVAEDLEGFHLYHATRAELLLRDGQDAAAVDAFDAALANVGNERERAHLRRRRDTAAATT